MRRNQKRRQFRGRKALSILGLAATLGYVVPTVLTVSDAEARTRRRTERRTRRHRTRH
jgi:hypothetical protein